MEEDKKGEGQGKTRKEKRKGEQNLREEVRRKTERKISRCTIANDYCAYTHAVPFQLQQGRLLQAEDVPEVDKCNIQYTQLRGLNLILH